MSSHACALSTGTIAVASRRARAPAPRRARAISITRAASASPPETTSTSPAGARDPAPHAGPPRVVILGGGFGGLYTALKLDALTMRDVEAACESGGSAMKRDVAVIGGGLSGVELAGVVAERLKGKATVTLFASEAGIMPGSPPGQRDAARKTLDAAGVATRVGARATAVNEPSDSYAGGVSAAASVTYTEADGEPTTEDYDVVCWAVGQRVESPESWPFPRDERTNKIAAEKTLRVTGHARVFAVGDVARLSDDSSSDARTGNDAYVASPPPARFDVLPATAQVAFQQADYAAWNVWSSLSSRPLLPFKYQHIGDMMVLGKTDAAVALPVGDATLDGPVAALLRRAAYLYRMPTNEHRAKLATSWLEQGAEFAAKEGPGILKSLGVPVPDFLAPNQGPNSRT